VKFAALCAGVCCVSEWMNVCEIVYRVDRVTVGNMTQSVIGS
jgi:hypothetical protein